MILKLITPLLIILCGTSFTFAQPGPKGHDFPRIPVVAPFGGPPGMHGSSDMSPFLLDIAELQKMLIEIGIAQQTNDKIIGIVRAFLTLLDDRLIKIQREELNIKEALLKEKPDLKSIQAYTTKKAQIFSEIEFAQIKRDLEIKSLLSRDEYDKWKSLTMHRMHKMMPIPDEKKTVGPETPKRLPPK